MADYFDQQPNFVNPAYASDRQRSAAQAYAEALMKEANTPATRPTGAIANMISALTAGIERRNTNSQEAQMYAQALRDNIQRANSLPGGGGGLPPNIPSAPPQASLMPQPSNPAVGGGMPAALMQPPTQAKVDQAIASRTNFDGSPRVLSLEGNVPVQPGAPAQVASLGPAGGGPPVPPGAPSPAAAPVAAGPAAPNFDQRFAQSFPNRNQDLAAGLARMQLNPMVPGNIRDSIEGGLNGRPVEDVYGRPGVQSPYTGVRSAPVNGVAGAFTPGVRTPTSISPEGISGTSFTTGPNQSNTPAMGGTGLAGAKDTMNDLRLNAAKSGAVNDIAKADIQGANDAPTIKRVAGVMLDDLRTHGDKMTFGPTAEWSNQVRKVAANYAPGLMKDSLESIASADSFDKMSAQLTGLLSKGGGTDAQLFNNLKSVPGSHNSKEGAEALLKMTIQTADQQQALRQAVSAARTPEEYQTLKDNFYKQNPIVNPLTGNPIKLDLEKQKATAGAGSYEKTATGPNGARVGLRNGKWEPIP